MIDLKDFTAAKFEIFLGENFQLDVAELQVIFQLIEVLPLHSSQREGGGFSLVWQGPLEPELEQGSYKIMHDTVGSLEIFIVPIAKNELGYKYEAVFT